MYRQASVSLPFSSNCSNPSFVCTAIDGTTETTLPSRNPTPNSKTSWPTTRFFIFSTPPLGGLPCPPKPCAPQRTCRPSATGRTQGDDCPQTAFRHSKSVLVLHMATPALPRLLFRC